MELEDKEGTPKATDDDGRPAQRSTCSDARLGGAPGTDLGVADDVQARAAGSGLSEVQREESITAQDVSDNAAAIEESLKSQQARAKTSDKQHEANDPPHPPRQQAGPQETTT